MKRAIQLCVLCMLFCLSACQSKKETLFLEKDGKLYEVFDQVSFYYPETFSLDTRSYNTNIIQFLKDEEVITYTTIIDNTDNKIEDMVELYEGQLQQTGASDISYKKQILDSGNVCYVYHGKYYTTGIKFMQVVCFSENATYVYAYQAPQDSYDKSINVVSKYLESLTVHYD